MSQNAFQVKVVDSPAAGGINADALAQRGIFVFPAGASDVEYENYAARVLMEDMPSAILFEDLGEAIMLLDSYLFRELMTAGFITSAGGVYNHVKYSKRIGLDPVRFLPRAISLHHSKETALMGADAFPDHTVIRCKDAKAAVLKVIEAAHLQTLLNTGVIQQQQQARTNKKTAAARKGEWPAICHGADATATHKQAGTPEDVFKAVYDNLAAVRASTVTDAVLACREGVISLENKATAIRNADKAFESAVRDARESINNTFNPIFNNAVAEGQSPCALTALAVEFMLRHYPEAQAHRSGSIVVRRADWKSSTTCTGISQGDRHAVVSKDASVLNLASLAAKALNIDSDILYIGSTLPPQAHSGGGLLHLHIIPEGHMPFTGQMERFITDNLDAFAGIYVYDYGDNVAMTYMHQLKTRLADLDTVARKY